MCADLLNLQKDLEELQAAGVEYYHLDVMDGYFVNNITLGIDHCRRIAAFPTPRDIHLLVQKPQEYIQRLLLKQGDILQVHFESDADIVSIARQVHATGSQMGVVLNPETQIEQLESVLSCVDWITLMMIKPGFAGRPMEAGMLEKIHKVRVWLNDHGYGHILLQVDGNVSPESVGIMRQNGADMAVAGTSSIFREGCGIADGVTALRQRSLGE